MCFNWEILSVEVHCNQKSNENFIIYLTGNKAILTFPVLYLWYITDFISVCLHCLLQLFLNSFKSIFNTSALQGTFPRVFTDHWTILLWLQTRFHTISCHLKRLMWARNMSLLPTVIRICKFSFTCDLFLQIHQFPRLNTKSLVIKCSERIFLWSYSEIFPIKLKNDWRYKGHIFHLFFCNTTMSEKCL